MKTTALRTRSLVVGRAIVTGIAIGLIPANVWPVVLLKIRMPAAGIVEIFFLSAYTWWASGGGPPRSWKLTRKEFFRSHAPSRQQWA